MRALLRTRTTHLWTEIVLDIVPENRGNAGHKSRDVLDTDFSASVREVLRLELEWSRGRSWSRSAFQFFRVRTRVSTPQEFDDRCEMAVNLQPEQRRERTTNLREKAHNVLAQNKIRRRHRAERKSQTFTTSASAMPRSRRNCSVGIICFFSEIPNMTGKDMITCVVSVRWAGTKARANGAETHARDVGRINPNLLDQKADSRKELRRRVGQQHLGGSRPRGAREMRRRGRDARPTRTHPRVREHH